MTLKILSNINYFNSVQTNKFGILQKSDNVKTNKNYTSRLDCVFPLPLNEIN